MDNSVCYFYLWVTLKVSTSEWPLLITLQFLAHMGLEKVAFECNFVTDSDGEYTDVSSVAVPIIIFRGNDWSINWSLPGPLTAVANPGILGGGAQAQEAPPPPWYTTGH